MSRLNGLVEKPLIQRTLLSEVTSLKRGVNEITDSFLLRPPFFTALI